MIKWWYMHFFDGERIVIMVSNLNDSVIKLRFPKGKSETISTPSITVIEIKTNRWILREIEKGETGIIEQFIAEYLILKKR